MPPSCPSPIENKLIVVQVLSVLLSVVLLYQVYNSSSSIISTTAVHQQVILITLYKFVDKHVACKNSKFTPQFLCFTCDLSAAAMLPSILWAYVSVTNGRARLSPLSTISLCSRMLVANLFSTLSSIVLRSDSEENAASLLTEAGLLEPPFAHREASVHGNASGVSALVAIVSARLVAVDPAARNATQHVAA